MLAYPETALKNLEIHSQAYEALQDGLVTKEEELAIRSAYPSMLYTPGDMVRVGLGLLTLFIIVLSTGLLVLLFSAFNSVAGFSIFMGLLCYAVLEMMASKRHFNSGVDNMLMIATTCFVVGGIAAALPSTRPLFTEQVMSVLVFGICTYMAARFVDAFMGLVAGIAFLLWVIFTSMTNGVYLSAYLPFILVISSALLFYLATILKQQKKFRHYQQVLRVTCWSMMVCFYMSGNYFFVNEVSRTFMKPGSAPGIVPFAWFFWVWTFAVPVCFLSFGIKTRNRSFIIAGLVLILMAILTFRYYHAIFPAEVAMFIAGIILIPLSYVLTRYLQTPRHGFVFSHLRDNKIKRMNVEGVIVGEVLSGYSTPEKTNDFGGGSFGGAGAGDRY